MSLRIHTAATALPVTLAEAKLHLRVDVADDDALITSLISAATLAAEHIMNRAVMPQKMTYTASAFDVAIELNYPVVTAVDSVKYINEAGALTTLDSAAYQYVMNSDYGALLVPAFGMEWPVTASSYNAVQVVFSCGYATAADVPEPIKAWIKLQVGAMYENRALAVVGNGSCIKLEFADSLLDRYKSWAL